jgi:hypothetical protein
MKKQLLTITLFLCLPFILNAQVYERPIAGKQSHPELEITKIEITESETIISLVITNKLSEGGWFCADENIFIKNSQEIEKYHLIKSENIPTCPDQFEFSHANQTLEFKLYFEKISNKIKFIDLIENCSNACFSFNRIILDNAHNEKIRAFETGFDFYQNKEYKKAIPYFEEVLEGEVTIETHIYGLSYHYLIVANYNLQNTEKANYWLDFLLKSDLKDKKTFLKELEKLGIYKNIQ